jgi:Rieske Fe-S protein
VKLPFLSGHSAGRPEAWRQEFPYRIDADEAIGRREFLVLAVLTSGAVAAATVGLALKGRGDSRRRGSPQPIVAAADVAVGQAHYFHYPSSDDQAVLIRLSEDRFAAYSQKCTHLSCAVKFRPDQNDLHCPCHEGKFDPATGEPLAGPPRRRLPRIELRQEGGMLMAVEEVP